MIIETGPAQTQEEEAVGFYEQYTKENKWWGGEARERRKGKRVRLRMRERRRRGRRRARKRDVFRLVYQKTLLTGCSQSH